MSDLTKKIGKVMGFNSVCSPKGGDISIYIYPKSEVGQPQKRLLLLLKSIKGSCGFLHKKLNRECNAQRIVGESSK